MATIPPVPEWAKNMTLGDFNKVSQRRAQYDWWNFFGIKPFPQMKDDHGNNFSDYSVADYMKHAVFHAIPTLFKNLLRAPGYLVRAGLRRTSWGLFAVAEKYEGTKAEGITAFLAGTLNFLILYPLRMVTYALRPLLSPEMAYKEARDTHPLLGYASFIYTVAIYSMLFFAPNLITSPLSKLFAAMGMSGVTHAVAQAWQSSLNFLHLPSQLPYVGLTPIQAIIGLVALNFAWYVGKKIWNIFSPYEKPTNTPDVAVARTDDTNENTQPQQEQGKKLRFLTTNLQFMPYGLLTTEALKPMADRLEAFLNCVSYDKKYDVVALQEVFSPAMGKKLRKKFKDRGYQCFHDRGLGNTSGLYIFVKNSQPNEIFEVLETTHHTFDHTNARFGEEHLATKGFIAVKIKISETNFITFITTHFAGGGQAGQKNLQAAFKNHNIDKASELRRDAAYGEILAYKNTTAEKPPKGTALQCSGVVMGGDFNQYFDSEQEINGHHDGDKFYGENQVKLAQRGLHYVKPSNVVRNSEAKEIPAVTAEASSPASTSFIINATSLRPNAIRAAQQPPSITTPQNIIDSNDASREHIVDHWWCTTGFKNVKSTALDPRVTLSSEPNATPTVISDHLPLEFEGEVSLGPSARGSGP